MKSEQVSLFGAYLPAGRDRDVQNTCPKVHLTDMEHLSVGSRLQGCRLLSLGVCALTLAEETLTQSEVALKQTEEGEIGSLGQDVARTGRI